jgi:CRP-like cAMP-binding protein
MPPSVAEADADWLAALSLVPLLSKDDAAALAPYFSVRTLTSGEPLWQEGDTDSFVALILSGRCEEKKATEFAGKRFVVGVYGRGALLGENSLAGESCCPVSAVCLEDARLLSLSVESFATLQQDNPQLALRLLKATNQSMALKLQKVFERLAAIF